MVAPKTRNNFYSEITKTDHKLSKTFDFIKISYVLATLWIFSYFAGCIVPKMAHFQLKQLWLQKCRCQSKIQKGHCTGRYSRGWRRRNQNGKHDLVNLCDQTFMKHKYINIPTIGIRQNFISRWKNK